MMAAPLYTPLFLRMRVGDSFQFPKNCAAHVREKAASLGAKIQIGHDGPGLLRCWLCARLPTPSATRITDLSNFDDILVR